MTPRSPKLRGLASGRSLSLPPHGHGETTEQGGGRPLPRAFYNRETTTVARELLGCLLVRRMGGRPRTVRIVEVEAYLADDPASHAYRGMTARNRSMFAGPGTLYVFQIHQVCCANAVTRPGEAVLIRAGEPILPRTLEPRGPGRLCRALGITRAQDGLDLVHSPVGIYPKATSVGPIGVSPRVGIRHASTWPLRFFLPESRWVSSPRQRGGAARLG